MLDHRPATMDGADCFLVKRNKHGEHATYAKFAFRAGEVVYVVRGEPVSERTRNTIEVGPGQHVEDTYALYLNHSFSPNLQVRGHDLVALADIAAGEELTFNYLESESAIASPFICHETGQPVNSVECLASPEIPELVAMDEGSRSPLIDDD